MITDKTQVQQVLQRLEAGEIVVPAAPVVLCKLRTAVSSPSVNVAQMATLVAQDQRLASEVLRLANTAQYARGGRISDLPAAVSRIGFRQIHQIVETVLLRSAFDVNRPFTLDCLNNIWRRSVATALASRALAAALPPTSRVDPNLAYLSGLFCDVGASFLLSLLDADEEALFCEEAVIQQTLGLHHQAAGKRILEVWDMEPVVQMAAASHHHDPKQLTGPGLYKAIVGVGSAVADLLQLPPDVTAAKPMHETELRALMLALRVASSQLPKFAEAIKPEYDAITCVN